jgi:carboxypeptidase C (cathepsin A)
VLTLSARSGPVPASLPARPRFRAVNGGPGCSSLEGGLSESGLYRVQEFTDPPQLGVNPFSWGNKTNNIFMEAPAGVGFSYCDTAAGCQHTDTAQAVDNLAALKDFFSKFPELAKNDFWITGESYAGIYIPTLAQQVILDNAKSPAVPIALKGILVGNGCIGNEAGHCGNDPTGLNDYHDIQIWRGHALVSETNYDNIMKNCVWDNQNAKCEQELQAAANAIGDIDIYYLYNTCDDPVLNRGAPIPRGSMLARVQKARQARRIAAGQDPLSTDPNCYATAASLQAYLNQADVKDALHVAKAIDYSLCSNNGTFQYNSNIADERKTVYPTITASGVTVVVYNGGEWSWGRNGASSSASNRLTPVLPSLPLSLNPRRGRPLRALHGQRVSTLTPACPLTRALRCMHAHANANRILTAPT